jgi:outer membrane protein assembly factor BamB
VVRRALRGGGISALAALTLTLASGCGGSGHPSATTIAPAPTRAVPTRLLTVVVIDGDTGASIRGARVEIAGGARRGARRFALRRDRPAVVQVSAPLYSPKTVRLPAPVPGSLVVRIYQPSGQWPMYGVDPARTQSQTSIPLRPPFRIAWGRELGALLEFPAAVDDGVAYLSNALGRLYALSMRDGQTLWQFNLHASQEASSPAVVGGTLVAHSKAGRVYVLDRESGRVLWSRATQGEIESSPVVDGGVDYLGDWSGHIYALDLRTRRFRWIYDDGCKITASAAVSGRLVFVGDYCGRIMALDRRSGRLVWSGSTGSPVYGAPAVAGGRVFVPSRDSGAVYAFTTSGHYLWDVSTGDTVYSAPAVWDGRVYFGSYSGVLYCAAAATGQVLWRLDVGGRISGSATVIDGVVYVGSFAHTIVGADALTGAVEFRFPHGEYVAVSGNRGRLLLYGWAQLWAVEPRDQPGSVTAAARRRR